MDAGELLVNKLQDLERRLAAIEREEYELVAASAILRHILLDGLLASANRDLRVSVRFEVAESLSIESEVELLAASAHPFTILPRWQCLDPLSAPEEWTRRQLRLDRFLAFKVLAVDGEFFSVKDIIRYVANAAGGVHFGEAQEEHEGLVYAGQLRVLDDVPTSITFVREIAEATLRALQPVVYALNRASGSAERRV